MRGDTAKQERGRGGRNAAPMPVQSIGPLLRERREAMGVTLAEAEVATRIRQKYLAALEADEWDLLPGEVVGRGFLRNYSTYLGLEATEMIERRRAVADESLSAVLVNTSAGSALPPERKVDYRPKDVALKDEGDELETPRQINWTPFIALLAILAIGGLGYLGITQLGPQVGELVAAGQRQLSAWQTAPVTEPVTEPGQAVAATLPPNLTAGSGSDAVTQATPLAVTPADAQAAQPAAPAAPAATLDPAAAAPATEVEPAATTVSAPVVEVQPTVAAEPLPAAGNTLAGLLPTPTPQPAQPTPAPTVAPLAASVNADSNLRGGPSTDYPIVAGLPAGQPVTITGISVDGAWYQLSDGSWVFGQLVTNPPTNLPTVEAPPLTVAPVEAAPVEAAPVEAAPVTP